MQSKQRESRLQLHPVGGRKLHQEMWPGNGSWWQQLWNTQRCCCWSVAVASTLRGTNSNGFVRQQATRWSNNWFRRPKTQRHRSRSTYMDGLTLIFLIFSLFLNSSSTNKNWRGNNNHGRAGNLIRLLIHLRAHFKWSIRVSCPSPRPRPRWSNKSKTSRIHRHL